MIGIGVGVAVASLSGRTADLVAEQATTAAAAVQDLQRDQRPEDIPVWIPPGFQPDSFRGASPVAADVRAFLAKDVADNVCMLVIVFPAQQTVISCGTKQNAIPEEGLRVHYLQRSTRDDQSWYVLVSGEVTPNGTLTGGKFEGPGLPAFRDAVAPG